MLNHDERLATARAAVDYITGRTPAEQQRPVPNCPGWTVYNAAAHVGRVAVAWAEMITSTPDDPESRTRGYDRSGARPAGTPTAELAGWAHAALDQLVDDLDRPCYFSMTGGEGTVRLWGWHAASELGVHRLDVEAALDHPYAMTHAQAVDAATYTARFFLPAMRRATGTDPGTVSLQLTGDDGGSTTVTLEAESESDPAPAVTVAGPSVQVLLALWGRPHVDVEVLDGQAEVWSSWRALPGQAFQFGTWD